VPKAQLERRQSERGYISAGSGRRSTSISRRRSSVGSSSGSISVGQQEDLKVQANVGKVSLPLARKSSLRTQDVSVDLGDVNVRDKSAPRERLLVKSAQSNDMHQDRSFRRSSRGGEDEEGRRSSATSLSEKLERHSRVKSVSRRASTSSVPESERRHRSSSRHRTSAESVGPRSSTISRRHSAEITSTKSVCNPTYSRRSSDPDDVKSAYRRRLSVDEKSKSRASMPNTSSEQKLSLNQSRGRSQSNQKAQDLQSLTSRGRSQSKSKYDSSMSEVKSIVSRGRSKSKSRVQGELNSILSAGRSFTRSLTRRRSLSRGASKVLETTSVMDGNKDAEPCSLRYEVPFNPSTGRCNYHPDVTLAVRNGGIKGGWRMVSDGCPKCA
jgi:hypothetical protein